MLHEVDFSLLCFKLLFPEVQDLRVFCVGSQTVMRTVRTSRILHSGQWGIGGPALSFLLFRKIWGRVPGLGSAAVAAWSL